MKIIKVFRGEADLDRKTYILGTLPFVLILSTVFLSEYFQLFENIMIRIFEALQIFGRGYGILFYLIIYIGAFAVVFILSGKRFVELEKPWYYAFMLMPFFFIVYLYLLFKEEPLWKIAERKKK